MNPTSKKFISLFLVFSLVMLSANLYAKERRGAKLIITKKNGYQTEGELITVKPNSLLLLSITGRDVSVDIADIKVIRVVKKSKALLGAGIGFVIGALALVILTSSTPLGEDASTLTYFFGAGIGGAIGAIPGVLLGECARTDKKIQIEGMTDSEIQETLDGLRKKARIRDYK